MTASKPRNATIKDICDISISPLFGGQNIDMISIAAKSISTHRYCVIPRHAISHSAEVIHTKLVYPLHLLYYTYDADGSNDGDDER